MIRLESVTKQFPNGQVAVRDLTLSVPDGEVCVLVGPSGCGKTTTLRMINRLIEPTSGRIFVDGDDVTHARPGASCGGGIGYVIQQVGLFPHQTIGANVAHGAAAARLGPGSHTRRGRRAARARRPRSGRRTATAIRTSSPVGSASASAWRAPSRADPPVLLMDEPFGAIDPVTRARLQDEFLAAPGASCRRRSCSSPTTSTRR